MTALQKEMIARFGENRVQSYTGSAEGDIPLLLLELEMRTPVTVIMTNGLAEKDMVGIPERYKNRNHCELYFCLPSYWEWDDINNPNMNWVFTWIQKLAKHLMEKDEVWYGPGHTFPNGNPAKALSETMHQSYLMLADPIFLEHELQPIQTADKTIHTYGIIPLFEDEFEWKKMKTTFKFLRRFVGKNYSELLDDYRLSLRTKRLKFW